MRDFTLSARERLPPKKFSTTESIASLDKLEISPIVIMVLLLMVQRREIHLAEAKMLWSRSQSSSTRPCIILINLCMVVIEMLVQMVVVVPMGGIVWWMMLVMMMWMVMVITLMLITRT